MQLEQRLAELIRDNQRGIDAEAAHSALQQGSDAVLAMEDFDRLVLRLQQKGQIDVQHFARHRLLRTYTAVFPGLPTAIASEQDLEPHVEGFLWRRFGNHFLDNDLTNYSLIVQNTAHGGIPAGLWTRPDLAAALVVRYKFTKLPQLDLYSFELKMPEGCTVSEARRSVSARGDA